MHLHRFFVPPDTIESDPVLLGGSLAHQLCHVLRLKPGDEIELLDNTGLAYRARLLRVAPRQCLATRESVYTPQTEPRVPIVLYQGVPRGHKIDFILQKATELGATEIGLVHTARSVPSEPERGTEGRMARWRRIVQEAAEQSGRARIPEITAHASLQSALDPIGPGELCLAGVMAANAVPVRQTLDSQERSPQCVRLFVGPEGGFEDGECRALEEAGVSLVSLGPRTLRTETAGLVMLAIVAYALGEMGPVTP